ncbi:hypothetical protein N658DRAFT_96616 [Parathielavia hyrcaniae]|uniref:Uncharacterized protein n=1 Tax=Parathielavia hyrcaniae TaxID=113614 RepID=A0AAN6Q1C9_9PEZI|nr:hypothetical protein N658DRAFT_96616 [Parathielavia hyrcaniae]
MPTPASTAQAIAAPAPATMERRSPGHQAGPVVRWIIPSGQPADPLFAYLPYLENCHQPPGGVSVICEGQEGRCLLVHSSIFLGCGLSIPTAATWFRHSSSHVTIQFRQEPPVACHPDLAPVSSLVSAEPWLVRAGVRTGTSPRSKPAVSGRHEASTIPHGEGNPPRASHAHAPGRY